MKNTHFGVFFRRYFSIFLREHQPVSMRSLFCIFFLFIFPESFGQKAPALLFRHLDYNGGLSDPVIQSLHSDKAGFLWLGTHNGLNRFDGVNCVEFRSLDETQGNNVLAGIYEDPDGDIYFGTQKGLAKYSYNKGSFTYFEFPPFKYYYAYPFFAGEKIWCNVMGGIYVIDSTFHFLTDKNNGRSYVGGVRNGRPEWFISNASHSGLFVHYMNDDYSIRETKAYFRDTFRVVLSDVYVASDSVAWIASDKGLIRLNPHTGDYHLYDFGVSINCLFPYKDALFVGTNGEGLQLFDTQTGRVIGVYTHQYHNKGSLSGNQIMRIHIDDRDNLYVSVFGKGLDYAHIGEVQFTHLLDKESAVRLNADNHITAILTADNGEIWCATYAGGILVYDKRAEKILARHFPKSSVRRLFHAGTGKLFVELDKHKYYSYSFKNRQFTALNLPDLPDGVSYITEDPRNQQPLLCTPQGVAYLRPDGTLRFLHKLNNSIEWSNVSHIVFLSEDEMLIQTYYTNLALARREKDDFAVVREVARTPFNINASFRIKDRVYLATSTGLYLYDAQELNPQPLLSAFCTDMVAAGSELWINSNNGLYRYNIESGEAVKYTESDGLQGAIFNANTLELTSEGKVITGGSNGVNLFDPRQIGSTDVPVRAYITRININDVPYTEANPVVLKALDLDYRSNTVSFQITPLDFRNGRFRKMKYQLVGYDEAPIETVGVSEVRYARLPPGTYDFTVFVEGNPVPTTLKVTIIPPFWQTTWFYVVSVLTVLALTVLSTYGFARWVRNSQLEKMRIMLTSQEEERKRIAVDLHDDLGGRLSSLKLYMQATARDLSGEQKEKLRDTTRLLDEAISELRNILFNLSPKTLDENGLEAAIKDLAGNIGRITGLKMETNMDTGRIRIGRPVQYAVYRICQELINNTLKHSGATQTYISLINREDGLVFLYEDNGKGFSVENVKAGYGLTNIKTHAQTIYSDLTIDSSAGKGTAVTLIIPKDTLSYEPNLS